MDNDAWIGRYADAGSGTVATSAVTGRDSEGIAPHSTIESDLGLVSTSSKITTAFAPAICTQSTTGIECKVLACTDLTDRWANAQSW